MAKRRWLFKVAAEGLVSVNAAAEEDMKNRGIEVEGGGSLSGHVFSFWDL